MAEVIERNADERALPGWLWILAAVASTGLALASFRYFLDAGPMPPKIVANALAVPWLKIHIAGAATALLVGSFQFIHRLRRYCPPLHRWTGRLYVSACLVGGATGFVLALGTTMGPVATAGFGTLAVAWLVVTARGWLLARQRRFSEHRRWMIRSWALTIAAVNLRIYILVAFLIGLPFDASYPVISFLAWVPNLIAAEIYLRSTAGASP
ncbi:DUF2306 domain-containing protein [Roseiarcaceae bacterium H3SJ34-1]|uniref:DUF2306 domain-containing protein n=1 Tax=Terripilifer ovatus TaxID=3032367 RepID=UPI003AB9AC96|nr:DUF2306 domain-containing protein [Roseiarcaceae bacterium H3SJ34-1]